MTDDLRTLLTGKLAPTIKQTLLGNAQILEVFNISKVGKIAGCRVTEGVVRKGARVRIIRDDVVVLALSAAEKVTKKSLSDDDHRKMVEDALADADLSGLQKA